MGMISLGQGVRYMRCSCAKHAVYQGVKQGCDNQQQVSVTLHILWTTVPSYLFLWPTVCEWHYTFCERQSHHIFPMTNSLWVAFNAHFVRGSLIWTSVPMTNREWVTLHILWKAWVSSHLFLWPTVCEWYFTFVKASLIISFPMTNRKWVTLHIL